MVVTAITIIIIIVIGITMMGGMGNNVSSELFCSGLTAVIVAMIIFVAIKIDDPYEKEKMNVVTDKIKYKLIEQEDGTIILKEVDNEDK